MSATSGGPGWWQASDGKWYPPEQHPTNLPPSPPGATPPAPVYPGGVYATTPRPQETSGLAIASLVLSILWLGGLGALLAVIFAVQARKQIRQSGGAVGGNGLATAGLVIGIVGLVGAALFFLIFVAVGTSTTNAVVASCDADAASVKTAVDAYDAINGTWPSDFGALTSSANGGPYLRAVPSSSDYTIFFSSTNGAVYVYGPNTSQPSSFSSSNAWSGLGPNDPCDVVAR